MHGEGVSSTAPEAAEVLVQEHIGNASQCWGSVDSGSMW